MNRKKDESNPPLEKASVGKRKKKEVNKLNPSTVIKHVREAYTNNPEGILKVLPEEFRELSKEERDRRILERSYFENYLTERERADFSSQVMSLIGQTEIKREEAIKIFELVAALGIEEEPFKSAFLRACQILEL
ncbi:MAG TPA: hypothetical protein VIO11_02685, partial [Candidatus Methanoperedens sp.]